MEDLIKEIVSSSKTKFDDRAKAFHIDSNIKEQLRGLGYIE